MRSSLRFVLGAYSTVAPKMSTAAYFLKGAIPNNNIRSFRVIQPNKYVDLSILL